MSSASATTLAGPKVAIVNERFARYFFGNGSPIGRKFFVGRGDKAVPDIEIVGVVKDTHYANVRETSPRIYYLPWRQDKEIGFMTFYLRSALPPEQVMDAVRRVTRSLDPNLPAENLRTFDSQIQMNLMSDRVLMHMAAAFAILATTLAMLGLYGVMAHAVARRTREIGIRMALGAEPGRIRGMIMREVLWILAIGLGCGVPAALGLTRYAESLLYGVKPVDPVVIAAALAALGTAAVAAGYAPALRASRVDPIDALRYE